MKSVIALAVFFLVCGAQARVTKDDVESRGMFKEQLKIFIDYVEATMKPTLNENRQKFEQIKKDMENASIEAAKFHDDREKEILEILMSDQQTRMREAAAKLKIDTTMCDREDTVVAMNYSLYKSDVMKCSQDNVSKSLELVHEALEAIDKTYATIAEQASNAKKCVDEATLSSSLSVAKCLTKAKVAADMAWIKAPGQLDLLKLKIESLILTSKLDDCKKNEAYKVIKAEAISVEGEIRDCLFDLIIDAVKEIKH
ncbi:hypothetical protein TKK_0005310 [Trichogramma kaykai]|uniref:Protein TsetseEP domain-containing protein n=1 Tax=Trichogramma kaykai TaxID=54128 RepID=A0ABD2XJ41_9HYME